MIIIILALLFGLFSAFSVVLTGNRALISGSFDFLHAIKLITDWRFLLSMVLALASRLSFILINNQLLKNPTYAKNSTTITAAITSTGYILLVLFNFIFLSEKLSLVQLLGMGLIIAGVIIVMSF
jgi:uncharacterized membrane protein